MADASEVAADGNGASSFNVRRRSRVNVIWLLADRAVRLAFAFVVGVWLARRLGPETYGALSWAQSTVGMVGFLATLGLESIVIRQLVDEPDLQEEILAAAWLLRSIGGLLAVATATAVAAAGSGEADLMLVTSLIAMATVFQSFDVIDTWIRQRLHVPLAVVGRCCGLAFGVGGRVLAIGSAHPLSALGAAIAVEAMLVAIGLMWAYRQAGGSLQRWRPRLARMRTLLIDARALLLAGFAVSLYVRFGSVWLAAQNGSTAVGLLGVATAVSEALHAVPIAVMSIYGPQLLARRHEGGLERLAIDTARVLAGLTTAGLVLALLLTLTARPLLTVVFGPAYSAASTVLAIHVWSAVFVFVSAGSEPWMMGHGLQHYYLPKTLVAAVTCIGLNIVLIPIFGASGAAWAVLGSYSASAYWSNALFRRTRPLFMLQTQALVFCYKPLMTCFMRIAPDTRA